MDKLFVICLHNNHKNKIEKTIKNYLDLFINTSLNHIPITSRLVSQPKNKLILNSEQLFYATDLSPITYSVMLSPNSRGKNSTNSQDKPGFLDEHRNSKVQTIKILLDSGASASIVRKDILFFRHRIHKDKNYIWSNMAGTFNATFVTEIILKMPKKITLQKFTRNAI